MSKQQYPPVFFCPYAKFANEEDAFRLIQFGELPNYSIAEYDKSSSSSPSHICLLDWCNEKEEGTYVCEVCNNWLDGTAFYICKECEHYSKFYSRGYHKNCIEPVSQHPLHPNHTLQLRYNQGNTCSCCSTYMFLSYSCSICIFTICTSCANKPPLLKIDNPKRHQHTLLYLPRKGSLICDVCALSDQRAFVYICLQCDFVVHKQCIYFPWIIKISRHKHRLSFNSSLTPEKLLCGVCRDNISTRYGRYSCIKGCSYGVHSKCATREDVWDRKELEGEPEDAYEDLKSFNEISDGIIQHFSHENHHMRLDEDTNRTFDENKRCQACTFPICDDKIYNCMQCDFVLHQECAYVPRKKQHATHPHLLSLRVKHYGGFLQCKACHRISNGFVYICDTRNCSFILDVCCASIDEPLVRQCHPHPLFLTSKPYSKQSCSICQSQFMHLNCGEYCDFVLCFGCATLPTKMRYKIDDHFLNFYYDKDASSKYLCDDCEKEVDLKKGMYMCHDCNVTLHIHCLLGEDIYMMPSGEIDQPRCHTTILPNNGFTRNICWQCNNRCQGKIVYEGYRVGAGGTLIYQQPMMDEEYMMDAVYMMGIGRRRRGRGLGSFNQKQKKKRSFCSYNCLVKFQN